MALSEWHRATLEPTVKDLWDPPEDTFAHLGWDGDVINALSMEVFEWSASRELLKLSDRADADDLFKVVRDPKRNWITPVSAPREAPVSSISEPVLESLLLHEGWHPFWVLIIL